MRLWISVVTYRIVITGGGPNQPFQATAKAGRA